MNAEIARAFLDDIKAHPNDAWLPGIFADWLDDFGESVRAAAVRFGQDAEVNSFRIPALLGDYNWEQTFAYGAKPEAAKPGPSVALDPFDRSNVKLLFVYEDGDNDGPDWVACGQLWDGRFFVVRAGCDYTGWD